MKSIRHLLALLIAVPLLSVFLSLLVLISLCDEIIGLARKKFRCHFRKSAENPEAENSGEWSLFETG